MINKEDLIELSYNKTNFKKTIKRLKNCYTCKYLHEENCQEEHCIHCPPQRLMYELNHIIDYYYEELKERKNSNEKN